jgi:hypothetical protein
MKEFNWIEDLGKDAVCYGNHDNFKVFGFVGDTTKYHSDDYRLHGESIPFASPRDRKSESDRHVAASILIYTVYSESLNWNSLYRNTKGVYFKKGSDKFYIKE